jgi:prepilin-type N-terminal cleavage/methylation domain-containing protein
MKNDDIAKGPSGSPTIGGAGGGSHARGLERIHFTRRGITPRRDHLAKCPEETLREVIKKDSGFTLIELLITMSILGIIASFAMPSVLTSLINAKATTCLLYRQNIQVATDVYLRMNSGQVDDSMPTLVTLVSEGLLPVVDTCPSNGIYVWNNALYKGIANPFFLYCSVHFAAP